MFKKKNLADLSAKEKIKKCEELSKRISKLVLNIQTPFEWLFPKLAEIVALNLDEIKANNELYKQAKPFKEGMDVLAQIRIDPVSYTLEDYNKLIVLFENFESYDERFSARDNDDFYYKGSNKIYKEDAHSEITYNLKELITKLEDLNQILVLLQEEKKSVTDKTILEQKKLK